MAKVPTEDELNLRRKARRRLIGAVALTLAVVVILPMVLESEPKPTGKDIELRIPSPDKVGAFVPGAAVSEAPDVAQPATQTSVPATAPAAVTPAPATSVIAIPAPAEKPLAPTAQATPDTAATPQPVEAHEPVEARKTAKTADSSASAEGYVAQVGAYTNPNTAKQELKKLKHWGFKAYTEKSGDMIRVRVGPYPDREQAEKVVPLLEKHGLHPVIFSAK